MSGAALAGAAEALVGTRFRLHGRSSEHGVDCIGLLAAALDAIGRPAPLPTGYALRTHTLPALEGIASACGFVETEEATLPGDVLMYRVGPCQHHFAIAARRDRFVHAHAGLRRVVLAPAPLAWPVLRRWRLL